MDVIERIGVLSPRLDEGFLFPGDPRQNAQIEKAAAYRDQLAPLLLGAKRERKVEGGELRLCCELEQFLAQEAQRNLRIGPFEDGAGEAQ